MKYEEAYLSFLLKLQNWSEYSSALAEMWQTEEVRQKGKRPDAHLKRLRAWAKDMEKPTT